MTKSKSVKRKQKAAAITVPSAKKIKPSAPLTPPSDETHESFTAKSLETFIDDADLEITVETLQTLSQHPSLIKSKACKDLRVAVYDFRQACTTGVNINAAVETNLTGRITAALADGKYTDARILLAEMRIREQSPKLGALCRWVRDLDVVSGLSMQELGVSRTEHHSAKDKELLRVLDAILRVTGPIVEQQDLAAGVPKERGPIALQEGWSLRSSLTPPLQVYQSVLDNSIHFCAPTDLPLKFRIIETTPGPLRKPPNLHPAILHASKNNTIPLATTGPSTTHHIHPVVPNLHLLKDVLEPTECTAIISAAETVGFTPDAPILSSPENASVLAHNFYWIIDVAFHDALWNRVKAFVPSRVSGKQVRGLNRRFRVYRYVPGAEYRCHIDGAWPPSSIDPVTDEYIYDSSPPTAKQSSLFTFLIYLNDEFMAGETTFFLPAAKEGVLNAYPVRPLQGSVAVFPHGEAVGSLLHEGTGVREGAKYIIRTDVLYDVDVSMA